MDIPGCAFMINVISCFRHTHERDFIMNKIVRSKQVSKTILHVAEAPGGVERYLVTLLTKLKKYPEYEHVLACSTSFDKDKLFSLNLLSCDLVRFLFCLYLYLFSFYQLYFS